MHPRSFFRLIFTGIAVSVMLLTVGCSKTKNSGYLFHEHLSEAEAFIVQKVKPERTFQKEQRIKKLGRWQGDRFLFPGLDEETPIRLSKHSYKGSEEDGIFVFPSENAIKVLRFYRVPSGSKMRIDYGIDDIGASLEDEASVYLTVRIGNRKVARIQVPNRAGWNRKMIDLGVLSYLTRPVVVSFEVTSDNIQSRRFSFVAEMIK